MLLIDDFVPASYGVNKIDENIQKWLYAFGFKR